MTNKVLILILLEVGLLEIGKIMRFEVVITRLNPYSTGSWFAGYFKTYVNATKFGLNPYSTGSWFAGNKILIK